MAQVKAILSYQEIDKDLYKLERDLAGCDERKEYVKVKKFLETAPEKLDSLEVKAVALKNEATEISKKYLQTEETLKDFENLDELVNGGADISFYKKKAQSIVEQLKKLKADLNVLTTNIKDTDAVVVGMYPKNEDQPALNSLYTRQAIERAKQLKKSGTAQPAARALNERIKSL